MSIPSPPPAFLLPDFRNQGIWLRLLLAANGLMLVCALCSNRSPAQLPREIAELASLVEPALLLTLILLYALSPVLKQLPGRLGALAVIALAMVTMGVMSLLLAQLFEQPAGGWRAPLAAGAATAFLLGWFDLSARARAPALAEARLAALTARIRPHFLYNSLNAVLGVIREDPRRAEQALEALAELFRALMRDNRELAPLAEDIALARKYLDIERLRLGERLIVRWAVAPFPPGLLAPPLLLQPLIENAIHHGIEPLATPGEIDIVIAAETERIRITIANPFSPEAPPRPGNQMALANLRERLMLFYDLEARLETASEAGRFTVRVDLPLRRAS
ncbi:MAG: histidine kinase [Rhodocyclaceae bacterium]|nr:histidine kinase [Rhodocyclaceae bacterium]